MLAAPRSLVLCLLAAAAIAAPRRAAAFTWEPCDTDAAPFKPSEVTLTPDPPVIGDSVTFVIKAAADRAVSSGTIAMSVAFSGTPIFEGSDDLCGKTACPMAPGPVEITYRQDLPPIAPPGDYDVTLKAKDGGGAELLCVTVHFTMVPPPSVRSSSGGSSSGVVSSSGSSSSSGVGAAGSGLLGGETVAEGRAGPSRRRRTI